MYEKQAIIEAFHIVKLTIPLKKVWLDSGKFLQRIYAWPET